MREQTAQLMEAIGAVKQAVDGMTMRIDRVVEHQHPQNAPSRRASP
jgi:hypothetical protein